MFGSHAVYDPCVWHTHGALKTHEKQKVRSELSPLSGSLDRVSCLMSWSLAQVPNFCGRIQPPVACDKSHILRKHMTRTEVPGNLVWGSLQKPNQGPDTRLKEVIFQICSTKVNKINLQVTQIPEILWLFVPWHRLNQLQLYWTAFTSRSNM